MAIVWQVSACARPLPVAAERDIAKAKVRPRLVMTPHPRGRPRPPPRRYRVGEELAWACESVRWTYAVSAVLS
ncbi:hypothetical protein GCM10009665_67480 [Kitasatospora nipponensis]|uniref:Uncharacterized protein n=1 Tax=Kitasatospora nipponensis TaxID=258049 RepID=A0ABN1WYK1_9ACTN